ncbi:LytTR family DNA-binding domain-containing protein [Porphyromonas sp. COT-108 OH1349]|uniref:LytR/AlgR family response regulator transcription factor n=1 Tax=Porphyromonas sp. COT-108 OH1349 TaxID=1537504 RepID=UPI00068E7DDB|nr:LytTR family DNA-binding domain-containing protein [Porphyromonas sp. COT-108 OH1349]
MEQLHNIEKHRIFACLVIASVYTFAVGGLNLYLSVWDILFYAAVLFLGSYAFSYLLRFSKVRVWIAVALLCISIVAVGAEYLFLNLFESLSWEQWLKTAPVRVLITCLFGIIFMMRYLNKVKETQEEEEKIPVEEQALTASSPVVDKLTVRSGSKIRILSLDEILYIAADGDYIAIHTPDGHWLKEQTMKATEDMLPQDLFVRVHRSYIVNVKHIARIERYGEQRQLVLHSGDIIRISLSRYRLLRQKLGL